MDKQILKVDLENIDTKLLKEYFPKNEFFTSVEEMHYVEKNLYNGKNLIDFGNKELQEIRNFVVRFYTPLIDENFDYMSSMQSITAIIDNIIYLGMIA